MSATAIVIIPFYDSAIRTAKVDGQIYVALKPLCEHARLYCRYDQIVDKSTQKLFDYRTISIIGPSGKPLEQVCIPLEQLSSWFNSLAFSTILQANHMLGSYRREAVAVIEAAYVEAQLTQGETTMKNNTPNNDKTINAEATTTETNEAQVGATKVQPGATEEQEGATETAIIPFRGSAIRAAKKGDQIYIAVKPICDHLDISWGSQRNKLVSDERFKLVDINTVAEDGKLRDQTCLPQDQLLGWLYTINANKVKADSRELLLAYQKETTKAINDYWVKGQATNPRVNLPDFNDPVASARAWADAKEAEQAATKALELAAPKAAAFDDLISAEGLHSMAAAAKMLGTGRTQLFALLREKRVLMSRHTAGAGQHNLPYQKYCDAGYFKVKAYVINGTHVRHTTYVTPEGLAYLHRNFFAGRKLVLPQESLLS